MREMPAEHVIYRSLSCAYSAIEVPDFFEAASIRLLSLGLADFLGQKNGDDDVVL